MDNSIYENRVKTPSGNLITTTFTGESFTQDFRRLDIGFKLGFGFVTQNFYSFGVTYQTGFIDISTEPGELRNQSLGFYMRVFFDEIL